MTFAEIFFWCLGAVSAIMIIIGVCVAALVYLYRAIYPVVEDCEDGTITDDVRAFNASWLDDA